MGSVNLIMLLGTVDRDAQMKTLNETTLTTFTLTTRDRWTDRKSGKSVERVEKVPVTVWGRYAEDAANLRRGQQVYVEGKIQRSEWKARDGSKRSETGVRCSRFTVLDADDTSPFEGHASFGAMPASSPKRAIPQDEADDWA